MIGFHFDLRLRLGKETVKESGTRADSVTRLRDEIIATEKRKTGSGVGRRRIKKRMLK